MSYGTINGAGELDITNSLSWTGGTMTGSGTTVIPTGATATLNGGGSDVSLDGRTFDNRGTTLAGGSLRGAYETAAPAHSTPKPPTTDRRCGMPPAPSRFSPTPLAASSRR